VRTIAPILLVSLVAGRARGDSAPGALPRSRPEAQGISSAAILGFVEAADRQIDSLNSFMLVRHGQVVAEGWWSPYGPESAHELFSLSKSFTSTAVGLAVAEGRMSIDDTVLSFFPEDTPPEPQNNLKAMRVRDLLCMSTGHEKEPPAGRDKVSVKAFLEQPVPFKPGTHFLYNTAATFVLSAIVQKATGQTLLEFLRPRLFQPLGIDHPSWEANLQGISLGGYGLSIGTEDIARFGQLYLQRGKWGGKQLVPAEWVDAASGRQTSNGSNPKSDWDQGYGFQFWRCRHGAYRGDGAFGQYCIVLPEEDAVLAITSGLKDMQEVLNLVWDKLLPAMERERLPENPEAQKKLDERLRTLVLRMPAGAATSPVLARISGKRYAFPPNDQNLEAVTVEAGGPDTVNVVVRQDGVDQRFACRPGRWERGRHVLGSGPERAMAASGAWTSEDTLVAKLCFYETPFCLTMKLQFTGDQLFHEAEMNVSFGPTKRPRLEGRLP
jgi:CubicO group peptidase (beta-lactamase class C family)